MTPEDITRVERDDCAVAITEAKSWFFIARLAEPWGRPVTVGCAIRGRDRAEQQRRRLARTTDTTYVLFEIST